MTKNIVLPPADAFNYPYRGYKRSSKDFYKELKASKTSWQAFRAKLLQQQNFQCAYCLCPLKNRTMNVEHVLALSIGGDNTKDNMVASCQPCNKAKGYRKLKLDELVKLRKNLKRLKKTSVKQWVQIKEDMQKIIDEPNDHLRSIMRESN